MSDYHAPKRRANDCSQHICRDDCQRCEYLEFCMRDIGEHVKQYRKSCESLMIKNEKLNHQLEQLYTYNEDLKNKLFQKKQEDIERVRSNMNHIEYELQELKASQRSLYRENEHLKRILKTQSVKSASSRPYCKSPTPRKGRRTATSNSSCKSNPSKRSECLRRTLQRNCFELKSLKSNDRKKGPKKSRDRKCCTKTRVILKCRSKKSPLCLKKRERSCKQRKENKCIKKIPCKEKKVCIQEPPPQSDLECCESISDPCESDGSKVNTRRFRITRRDVCGIM